MTWEDPRLDPIPPGHGEPRLPEGEGVPLEQPQFGTTLPIRQTPPTMFGVPQCQRCWYFHTPEEGCNR